MMFGLNKFATVQFARAKLPTFVFPTWFNICPQITDWDQHAIQIPDWANEAPQADSFTVVAAQESTWDDQAVTPTDWDNQDKPRLPVRPCIRR